MRGCCFSLLHEIKKHLKYSDVCERSETKYVSDGKGLIFEYTSTIEKNMPLKNLCFPLKQDIIWSSIDSRYR